MTTKSSQPGSSRQSRWKAHENEQRSVTYPSLSPRIIKTLLLAPTAPGKSKGTREGAIHGLVGVLGKEAVTKGLIEGDGVKLVGSECPAGGEDANALVNSVMNALRVVHAQSDMADSLDMTNPVDAGLLTSLRRYWMITLLTIVWGCDLGSCGSW
ncbi:hypothetical protein BDN72DRAFT_856310 [Pluteus cervinus]|uniref:Uncharacterized protein n=1 Tax=Pluteus cervinus TaxID=181527 RepID=A0ACD3B056_9AGAR|nr:hypothetical protein BDN72DRAFT_856310 [Pluteus cervinus]